LIEGVLSRRQAVPYIQIPFILSTINLDVSWLLLTPAVMWALATIYVPIIGPGLYGFQAWIVALVILMGIFVSLVVHVLAHASIARLLGCDLPARLPVHILGDAAQVWPVALGAGKEALVSVAGVLAQVLLAVLAYFLWNAQINQFINVISFFLILFNLGLMAFNLTPTFPFDGGRLVRSVLWRLIVIPGSATRLVFYLGIFISFAIMGWSVFLVAQQTRLSLGTGTATFILGFLILYSLVIYRSPNIASAIRLFKSGSRWTVMRVIIAIIFFLLLTAVTFSLMPMNYGLEAPGFTASVEPMVKVPQEYRYSSKGNLIISSVILQAPILVGEWGYGHLDTSVQLVPQEKIVPVTTAVQSVAQTNYQMLLDSETTSVIVGLRLAGYPVGVDGTSVQLPFPVEIVHQKTDGGPSAGMMFTLGVYNVVTPHDLTGGRKIAGTGTIDLDGRVGSVGGIPQKVVAAERAGAQYFLCPSWNYQVALTYAKRMQVIKINTAKEAIDFLNSLPLLHVG
jgi:Lon-like protease